jgi:hypothetical protein
MAEKKEIQRNRSKNRREFLSLQGVASPSLMNCGGARLDRVRGHARALTKPHELGVYDGG